MLRDRSKEIYFFFACISAVVFAVQKTIAWSLKPTTKEGKKLAENLYRWGYSRERISPALVLKNEWLKNFNGEEKSNILYRAFYEVKEIFGSSNYGEYVFKGMEALIPTMTKEILEAIKESKLWILTYPNREDRLGILKKMALGYGFDEAVAIAKKEQLRDDLLKRERARRWEKIKKVLKIVFFLFVFLWWVIKKIYKFVSRVSELVTTLYRLYELFNKKCPYVTKKRVLKIS